MTEKLLKELIEIAKRLSPVELKRLLWFARAFDRLKR